MPDWFPEAAGVAVCLLGVLVGYFCAWAVRRRRDALAAARVTREQVEPVQPVARCLFDGSLTVPAAGRENEEAFVEAMPDAVILADADGTIAYASPAATALGLNDSGRLASDDLRDILALTAADGETRSRELAIPMASLTHALAAGGETSVVPAASGTPSGRGVKAGDDAPSDTLYLKVRVARLGEGRYAIFMRDMSEQRRFEAMRRDFVTNVSHELKTPAGAISLLAETVGDASDDPDAVKYFAGRITKESERLTELVHRLIDLQKAQSADEARDIEDLDVLDVARTAIAENKVQADAKHIALTLSLDGRVVPVTGHAADAAAVRVADTSTGRVVDSGDSGDTADTASSAASDVADESVAGESDTAESDTAESGVTAGVETVPGLGSGVMVRASRESLVTAVKNLVENAIHYSPERTTVRVAVARDGESVTIRVVDQGIGIPRESLGRIFERFYRVDPARSRATGGTGLGLSIVKHCVEEAGGTISVWSKPNEGSTFTIELPVAPADESAVPVNPVAAPIILSEAEASSTPVILSEGEAEVEESPSEESPSAPAPTPSTNQGTL